jgi:catechol 2,3-dioxygenase-like lactoylglutathione lyase family enzyme
MAMRPKIDCEHHHTEIHARDVLAAVDFYTRKLGFELGFTWGEPVTMAGLNLDKAQIFITEGTPVPAGCELFFVVGDANELFEFHEANGIEVVVEPADREYGLRDYMVRDLNGYGISFGHYIYTVGPRIPIQRVDVPVRLERRLAALLQDLAKLKRMSVDSTLEEILLHTNDGVGPHTEGQVRRIQELKEKHGIDYDTHGSYRFEEE